MQSNMVVESTKNDGSEQASSSDDGQFLVALRKMMKKDVEVVVIRTVQQVIVPIIGDLVRNVVKDEIQSALLARNTNEGTMSNETRLQLKFSNEVSDPVLTGNPLKAKEGDSLKVELVDRETGRVVENGPIAISSAKVEILVLDASHDDSEHNWTLENFNSKIISEGDKKRPHFSKNVFIYLEKGVGVLSNVKLGHDASWMKRHKCRLGARIVGSFREVDVQEARTGSFTVMDCRIKHNEKRHPPSLSDEVWRLDNIGRGGPPCKRLNKENVETVKDFLFLHSVDPHRLQKLVGAGAKWKATLDHAQTCTKDDKVYHYPSAESKTGVIFDAVGGLKGIINDSHYVPIHELSTDEKDRARELLLSAFENREARTSFDDEASLLKQFPYRSSVAEYIDGHYPVQPCISYQSNDAYIRPLDHPNNIDHIASTDTSCPFLDPGTSTITALIDGHYPVQPGISYQSNDAYIRPLDHPNNIDHIASTDTSCPFLDPDTSTITALRQLHEHYWESPNYEYTYPDSTFVSSGGDIWNGMILRAEPPSCQQSNARAYPLVFPVAKAKVWVLRAKKRVMASGGIHAHKKQKT